MTKRTWRKTFSICIVVIMLLQMLTFTASADNGDGTVYEPGKKYVVLESDVADLPEVDGYTWEVIDTFANKYMPVICGKTEHTHESAKADDCQGWVLTCQTEEHTHSKEADGCQAPYLICGYDYEHTHSVGDDGCQQKILTCDKHVHEDSCWETSSTYTCGREAHTHNVRCIYILGIGYLCGKTQHRHTSACYGKVLTCGYPEHVHGDDCYSLTDCSMGLENHTHSDACYANKVCQIEEHSHSAYAGACYTQNECTKEEHTHVDACYPVCCTVMLQADDAGSSQNGNGWIVINLTVTCASGKPASGVAVQLKATDADGIRPDTRNLTKNTTTDANGKVKFQISGTYDIINSIQVDGQYTVVSNRLVSVTGSAILGYDYSYRLRNHKTSIDYYTEPTCTQVGSGVEICDYCGDIVAKLDDIPALGHTEVTDDPVDPTCTETGLTEGSHCSVCDEILVAQETVDALGHTEVTDDPVDPTCTETGLTEGSHCSVCDEILVAQETVDALGHDWDKGTVTTEPTTTTEGVMTYTCKNDAAHTKTEVIPMLDEEDSDPDVPGNSPAEHNNPPATPVQPTANDEPATGDHTNVSAWMLMLVVSMAGVAVVTSFHKTKKDDLDK